MDRSLRILAYALSAIIFVLGATGEQRAKCKTLYPPYAVAVDDAQYVSDPYEEGTWDGYMIASKHANGDDSLEMLRLSINPGHGWPPHRHLEADEWIYVLSGSGGYSYWALEEPQPTVLSVGPGHALFNPQGQLHKVWNDGEQPLVLLAVSKSLAPYEVLADWPDTPGGGLGYVPHVAPWEMSCAPGHEPSGDDDAPELGDGGAVELAERRTAGELGAAATDDDYASSPEDYKSSDCGCAGGAESMSESDIALCMAEPDDVDELADYGPEVYGEDVGDEEPMFPLEDDQFAPYAHDGDEL